MNFDRLPGLLIEPQAPRAAQPLRLDGAVFVGVALRGPARLPRVDERWPADAGMVDPLRPRLRSVAVAIDSLDAYRRRFDAVESGAYLGRAVAAFFAQGGRRCWVMRIVSRSTPAPSASGVCAALTTSGGTPLRFTARDEGAWGNRLRGVLAMQAQAPALLHDGTRWLSQSPALTPVGTLLRWRSGAQPWQLLRIDACSRERLVNRDVWVPAFDAAPPPADARIEQLTVDARFDDGVSRERFSDLGLDPRHPRALAAVLCRESLLVWPDAAWAQQLLVPQAELPTAFGFSGGEDDFAAITPDDFFDPLAPEGFWRDDPDDGLTGGEGIDALRAVTEPALLVAPDLYHPLGLERDSEPVVEHLDAAGASFAPCRPGSTDSTPPPPAAFPGLLLDPVRDADRILQLQRRLIAYASSRFALAPLAALIDAPPRLSQERLQRWRRGFDDGSPLADAAAYAPWLLITNEAGRLVPLPPSAAAAGIVAARELRNGLPFGPAQQLALQAVMPLQAFTPDEADAWHTEGLNLYRPQHDGIALIGARTLSRSAEWRSLAARRVLHWLVRWLQREAPWLVFEPLNDSLAQEVQLWIGNLLRRLWRSGALRGASEAEAFFVRVQVEPSLQGELRVEIGLALAEPLEFIVVRLRLADDGLRLTSDSPEI